jgi:hypothetical protein
MVDVAGDRQKSEAWKQACLPMEPAHTGPDAEPSAGGSPLHGLREALHLADEAPDGLTRQEALAYVSAQLAEQARARGRRPVPKRRRGPAAPSRTNAVTEGP